MAGDGSSSSGGSKGSVIEGNFQQGYATAFDHVDLCPHLIYGLNFTLASHWLLQVEAQ